MLATDCMNCKRKFASVSLHRREGCLGAPQPAAATRFGDSTRARGMARA